MNYVITTPPLHTHYDEQTQRRELCGRVFCPYGYVGVKIK